MPESYGIFQILVHPLGSRVTQQYSISKFNTSVCGKGGRGSGRGDRFRGYGHGIGRGCGNRRGRGQRSYNHCPYELSSRYGTFVAEARV